MFISVLLRISTRHYGGGGEEPEHGKYLFPVLSQYICNFKNSPSRDSGSHLPHYLSRVDETKMADGRKRLGGWEYRRRAEEKLRKERQMLERTKKIQNFFAKDESRHVADSAMWASTPFEVPRLYPTLPEENAVRVSNENCDDLIEQNESSTTCTILPEDDAGIGDEGGRDEIGRGNQNTSSSPDEAPHTHLRFDGDDAEVRVGEDADTERREADLTIPTSPIAESCTYGTDPADWAVDERLRDFFAINGFPQNADSDFKKSRRVYQDQARHCTLKFFERKLQNGEISKRKWLIYSESKGSVFCGPCRLFSQTVSSITASEGFKDWKNANNYLQYHERSRSHTDAMIALQARSSKSNLNAILDVESVQERRYWTEVLKRVVIVARKLTSH